MQPHIILKNPKCHPYIEKDYRPNNAQLLRKELCEV